MNNGEREQPIELDMEDVMREIGHLLGLAIRESGENYGFALFVFPFGQGDGHRISYISNAQRADMLATLKEFIARAEGRYAEQKGTA